MKRLFTIFFALLLGFTAAFAQTQPTLPYQAVVRDNQNHLLKDADVSIDVQIYEGATLRYSETQTPHSNANGLISFNIGAGSGATGNMADVADWRVAKFKFTYHLTDGDVVVTDSVHAVPYALQTAFATGGNFLTSDSAVITTMQGNIATNTTDIAANTADIAALANRVNTFNTNVCDSVKDCDFSGNASIQNMLQELSDLISAQNHKIDSLAQIVDSLSNLTPGGDTPTATFTCGTDSIKDFDNNWYHTVKIGEQCWMKENLRTTSYANGTGIEFSSNTSTETAYRYYPNGQESYVSTYGYLYNWKAVMDTSSSSDANPSGVQGVCPEGWHVPSKAEFQTLMNYCSDHYAAGGDGGNNAKALASTTNWDSSSYSNAIGNNLSANNQSGFSALPAGNYGGSYYGFGSYAYFWSSTPDGDYNAYYMTLYKDRSDARLESFSRRNGRSVRCLRDAGVGGGDTPAETTLTLTTDKSSGTVKLCGAASVSVTYTATVENGSATEYTWSTSGGTPTESTTNTYTVNYTTTGTYTVTCTAAGITATKSVEIASGGTTPVLSLCEDCYAGSITVMTSTNVASIVWRNAANDSVSNSTTGLTLSATIPAGNYSATAASSDGCTVTRTATLGNATSHPCTVASFRGNESGTGTQLDSVHDHQDNWYRVVEINGKCWLAENMRCTTSPRNTLQSGGTSGTDNNNPKYYDYNSTAQKVTNSRARGLLYNWAGAMDSVFTSQPDAVDFPNRRGICPEGWHLPTDGEWWQLEKNTLTGLVSADSSAVSSYRGTGAGKLTGGCVWSSSTNTTAPGNYSYADRNNTGFSALPVGDYYGIFDDSGNLAYFWSATSKGTYAAWYRVFSNGKEGVYRGYNNFKYYGYSVRCVRDAEVADGQPCPDAPTVSDGTNTYNTVKIGSQCWMKENLRTTTHTYGQVWTKTDADPAIYGRYYDWQAAMQINAGNSTSYTAGDKHRGICPEGWHVPSDAEWTQLTNYVKGKTEYQCGENADNIAKALASKTGWGTDGTNCSVGNTPGNNDATGFSAVPAGSRSSDGFINFGNTAFFWSATQGDDSTAGCRSLGRYWATVGSYPDSKDKGYSVRCVRD